MYRTETISKSNQTDKKWHVVIAELYIKPTLICDHIKNIFSHILLFLRQNNIFWISKEKQHILVFFPALNTYITFLKEKKEKKWFYQEIEDNSIK